ncbi:MAG TPA: VCBS repeat-containing protein, partial [Bacteroidales bacterium]|nr:VCBS repeat-containing protein [Bacteroidales bacterium]
IGPGINPGHGLQADINQEMEGLFTDVTSEAGIDYIDSEADFVDFNIQKLIPHKLSEAGPYMAAGDIDNDDYEDFIAGGSSHRSAQIFFQDRKGIFHRKALLSNTELPAKKWDDMGILLFDADGDGDNDLYIVSGGYENRPNSEAYCDHFYVNDGKGNFTEDRKAIPLNYTSKACIKAADYDGDGDMDLFISGRVMPWNYPRPVSSFIYRNDSGNGKVLFTDVTREVAPDLINIGMVSDALFTDLNKDNMPDLVISGEWMPLTIFINEKGRFRNITASSGLSGYAGWWTSLVSGDFDNDGDVDFIAGNLGLNSFYRASEDCPVSIYSGDFDNNGSYDAFTAVYIITSQDDREKKSYPSMGRDDIIREMIQMRSRFQNYKSLAGTTIDNLFSEEQHDKALVLKANYLQSSFIRNDGNNSFSIIPLPSQAQLSALNGMIADDLNSDGNLDILVNTNDYSTEVMTGRYDALNGLVMLGNGHGGFHPLSIAESGIFLPGNGKSMVKIKGAGESYLVAAASNRGPLKIVALNKD